MSDPKVGLFRLWSIYEVEDRLRQQSTFVDLQSGDLAVDPDTQQYWRITKDPIGTPILTPWFLEDDVSNDTSNDLPYDVAGHEHYRIYVEGLRCYIPYTHQINPDSSSHYRLYRDVDFREVVSAGDVGDDSIQLTEEGSVRYPLYHGDTVYYVLFDGSENVQAIFPLIVYQTWNNFHEVLDRPVEVRLISEYINPSDPRLLDIRGVEYVNQTDLKVMVTWPTHQEILKVDGTVVQVLGLEDFFYSDAKSGRVSLVYRLADRDATVFKLYQVLADEKEPPYIEPLPDPVLEEVYSTSDPYPITLDNEDVIVDDSIVSGRAISREVIFSSSVLYPQNVFDKTNMIAEISSFGDFNTLTFEPSDAVLINSLSFGDAAVKEIIVEYSAQSLGVDFTNELNTWGDVNVRDVIRSQNVESPEFVFTNSISDFGSVDIIDIIVNHHQDTATRELIASLDISGSVEIIDV